MGGHIDCYLDCSSFYSYLTIVYLLKNRELLGSHDVTVDTNSNYFQFHPGLSRGNNHGSGNKPPWTLPAKATYGQFDSDRAKKYHGLEKISTPDFFPPVTLLSQRAMCYIKSTFSPSTFEKAWLTLFKSLWEDHINMTLPSPLASTLSQTKLFSDEEVAEILKAASKKEWKDKLLAYTQKALDLGAFGAPWFWVRNGEGKEEPFFGSDRFHFMWQYLGIPFTDIEIIPQGGEKAKL